MDKLWDETHPGWINNVLPAFLPCLGISDRHLHSGKSTQCHKMSNVGAGRSETTLIQARLKDIICISGITVSL